MFALLPIACVTLAQSPPPAGDVPTPLPVVSVDRDNIRVERSCRLSFANQPIADVDGNGVVHVVADGIVVDLGGGILRGAPASSPPESLVGTGVVVTGKRVTLRNGRVSGFRCGVLATGSDGSTFEALDLSDNVAMALKSTRDAEDGSDWLWPHENDGREWVTRYGAGLCIERSREVTVRDIRVRTTQNGILLDRVTASRVYDNDCSFLSGWGLAMWRSSDNVVCRNAFDFCIRGYSHGVYNRGQDSAGILMFEQCCGNTIALNSATHSGDGVFGFAGRESLGERPAPEGIEDGFWKGRGSNANRFIGNDFSHAAAHGLEMTFSFGNRILGNRFVGNAIAGVWAGYCQDTLIAFNAFEANGPRTDGQAHEGAGGAIDIEHGSRNVIRMNDFADDGTAIELWWDDDATLRALPWSVANGDASADNVVADNRFVRCGLAVALRGTTSTVVANNTFDQTPLQLGADERSRSTMSPAPDLPTLERPAIEELERTLPGLNRPVGARRSLGGREAIVMTPYGPWDHSGPLLTLSRAAPHEHVYTLVGAKGIRGTQVNGSGSLRVGFNAERDEIRVYTERPGMVTPYRLWVAHDEGRLAAEGCTFDAAWRVVFFPSVCDPRGDTATWREGATGPDSVAIEVQALDFRYGHGGPASLRPNLLATETLAESRLPSDHFGMIATTKVRFPKGTFTVRATSDDGVRVIIDGATVIEDWTHHAPREATGTVTFDAPKEVDVTVEHFELDGLAELRLFIDGEYHDRPGGTSR